jgi:esterase/lipase superfamily enzyme
MLVATTRMRANDPQEFFSGNRGRDRHRELGE